MSVNKMAWSVVGLMLFAVSGQLPVRAQSMDATASEYAGTAADLAVEARFYDGELGSASELAVEDSVELAQVRRRRTPERAAQSADFIGVGANFGYVDDVSAALIGKFSVADRVSIRPVVAFGENTMVQIPVTYEFSQMATNVGGFQLLPYAGVGGSWSNKNNNDGLKESDLRLLFSAGVDVPISRNLTVNAQANLGVINDTEFGATIGIGYNIGSFLR